MAYKIEDRQIYQYWNGAAWVFGDPLDLRMHVDSLLGNSTAAVIDAYNQHQPKEGEDPAEGEARVAAVMPAAYAALCRLCAAVREAFGLMAFDRTTGDGITAREVLGLWNHFVGWLEDAKKKSRETATSPPSSPDSA